MTASEVKRLAAALRALRLDAGLSTPKLADRLGSSQSKVSKTERGDTLPDVQYVYDWTSETGATRELQEKLVALAETASFQATEIRRALAPGRRRVQQEIQQMEQAASVVRVFRPDIIVGLIQTRSYVEAIFRFGRKAGPPGESLAEVVDARVARQDALNDVGKSFFILVGEAALRRRLVSSVDMHEQIKKLIEVSKRPNVTAGVIPFDSEETVHQYHGYSILGDPQQDDKSMVLFSTVTRLSTVRSLHEIKEYIEHFEALRVAALEGAKLRTFLRELIKESPW